MADTETGTVASSGSTAASGTGEEEDLLQQMIVERDERISKVIFLTGRAEAKAGTVLMKVHQVKHDLAAARVAQINMVDARFKHNTHLKKRIGAMEKDVVQQNGGLHQYANILKEAAPEAADSSYVVRMQSQLCKAMHSMGILEHQLEILNKFSAATIGGLKARMTEITEEKTKVEVEIMNELMVVDDGKRIIEEELKEQRREISELRQKQERLENGVELHDDDEEDYDDDDDEEEDSIEIDEDLLLEILDERKEDVDILKKETAEQAREIEALTAKLKALSTSGNASDDGADDHGVDNGDESDLDDQ